MSTVKECLEEAFAGESQANRKYLAFARKADREGHPQVARLFRAAAAAETVHAHNHLAAMGGIGGTRENLEEAIGGETHEFRSMYPGMIETAERAGDAKALRSFRYANEVEKIHAALYQGLLDTIEGDQEEFPYYVCPVCGHTAERGAPEVCPICGTKGSMYERID
ncbi:rubrerythrin family protein [Candidatus Fermentibacterales bacterium]|nr:rubrerythrin family protein [Candidatus Fermentibacterales bacterium]